MWAVMRTALGRARRLTLEKLLSYLRKDARRAICEELGLAVSGTARRWSSDFSPLRRSVRDSAGTETVSIRRRLAMIVSGSPWPLENLDYFSPMQYRYASERSSRRLPATAGLPLKTLRSPRSLTASCSNSGLAASTNVLPSRVR